MFFLVSTFIDSFYVDLA